MASVKKFPGCKLWYACYGLFEGRFTPTGRPKFRRVQKPTRLTDKNEAERLALAFEDQSKKAAAGAWNQAQARALTQQLQSLSGNVAPAVTQSAEACIKDWFNLFSADRTKSAKTKDNYSSIVDDILEHLGDRKTRPMSEITRQTIFDYRERLQQAKLAPSSINKAISVYRQICERACNCGAMMDNPFNSSSGGRLSLPKPNKKAQKRKHFTFRQFTELVKATDPEKGFKDGEKLGRDWQTFIIAAGYTGGRQQEPAKLSWSQIDLKRGIISLDVSKKDEAHTMPLHPCLLARLQEIRPKKLVGFVMPAIAAQAGQALSKTFREIILPRVGIVQEYHTKEDNPEKGRGRVLAEYSIHSLRHSLSTWLNEAGVSDATRMALVGHDDSGVSLGYTHVEHATGVAALSKVPSL